jgi:hypothetical protein
MPRLRKAGEAVVIFPDSEPSRRSGSETLRLFKNTRDNPLPDVELVSIDFRSAMSKCAPFLVALTVE